MKKIVLLLCLLAGAPLMAEAAVGIDIRSPGVSIHLGDRDTRGYYWDGYDWRAPRWWRDHQNRHWGERGPRGDYWNGRGWQRHPPVRRPPPPPRPVYHHAPPRPPQHRPQQHHSAPPHHNGRPQGGDRAHQPRPPQQGDRH